MPAALGGHAHMTDVCPEGEGGGWLKERRSREFGTDKGEGRGSKISRI